MSTNKMLTFPSTNRPRTQKSSTRRICNQRTALKTTTCSIKTPLRCIGTACNCYKERYDIFLLSLFVEELHLPPFFWPTTLSTHPPPHVGPCVQEDRRVRKMLRVDVAERVKKIERKYQEARRKFHQRARHREKLRVQIANRKKRKREASRR